MWTILLHQCTVSDLLLKLNFLELLDFFLHPALLPAVISDPQFWRNCLPRKGGGLETKSHNGENKYSLYIHDCSGTGRITLLKFESCYRWRDFHSDFLIVCLRNRWKERLSVSDAVIFHRKEHLRMCFGLVKCLTSLRTVNHGYTKLFSQQMRQKHISDKKKKLNFLSLYKLDKQESLFMLYCRSEQHYLDSLQC